MKQNQRPKHEHMSLFNYLVFAKNTKTYDSEKEESIFTKWYSENWMSTCTILKLDTYLSSSTKLIPNGLKT